MKLNKSNLSAIGAKLSIPEYDRESLKNGIVHIGVGGFHRSHQALYVHRLIAEYDITDWAICGVGLRPADQNMADALQSQNGLYTLITQHPSGSVEAEVVGSITEYLLAPDNPEAVISRMAHPDTKIISLTITEGGYNFDPVTGDFRSDNPDIQHDLSHPDRPRTVYGYLISALKRRRDNGLNPVTIMSCDNIQHNGDVARKMVVSYAELLDPDLAIWIEENVCFPNSMVDRITPVTTKEIINLVEESYQVQDAWPVVCEPFIQWVIEDNFSDGRPPLELVGVQLVEDVTPYEKMKIRLLNAGHSVLGIPGAIHGHLTIDACMRDDIFARFMRQFMDDEVTPILGKIDGVDLDQYKDSLEERFANPNIKDSVSRICSESSAKLPKFLIPTIRENLLKDGKISLGTFVLAAWCYYSDRGIDETGNNIDIIDDQAETLHTAAQKTADNWTSFVTQKSIFGDLIENERFVTEYTSCVKQIYDRQNIRELMEMLIQA